jgi:glycosyl transferase family 25
MSFTNHVVDEVVVINLKKDTQKLESITKQLEKQNIVFERFDAINGKTLDNKDEFTPFCNNFCSSGLKGCALSHYNVWKNCITKGYDSIMVLEDDAIFIDNFDEKFQSIYNSIPKDYDIIYLGSLFYCDPTQTFNRLWGYKNTKINENVLQVEGCAGTHAYIITRKCIEKIINEKLYFHIDSNLMDFVKKYNLTVYAVTPMLIKQDQNNSNISSKDPILLNNIFNKIPLTNDTSLGWYINETGFNIGSVSICSLMFIILLFGFLIPLRYYFILYIWLSIEYIYSKNLKSTFVYGTILSIPFFIKYYIYKH